MFLIHPGSLGNIMVCAVVYKNQRMQTAMNLFLVNLAVWDILVCLFNIPFTLIYNQLKSWPFGLFWCKTMPTLQVMSLTASTGSLVAITIERYRAICLPFTPPLSKFQAKLAITLVSITSFLLALPEVGAYNLGPPFGCMEEFPTRTLRQAYSLLLFLVCYLLPLLFLVPAYTKMIFKLWHDRDDLPGSGVSEDSKNRKRKRNVLKMMAVVVTCYALCVLPTYSVFLWLDFGIGADGKPDTSRFPFFFLLQSTSKPVRHCFKTFFPRILKSQCRLTRATKTPPFYFFILLSFAQIVNFSNSCVNPIIYWCLSAQFSKGFRKILQCDRLNTWTKQHSSTSSSEPNALSGHPNTVPTKAFLTFKDNPLKCNNTFSSSKDLYSLPGWIITTNLENFMCFGHVADSVHDTGLTANTSARPCEYKR
ncbi:Neuropeptide FF receptor 2 [Acropora cervicornis]|uniref:Neuropeptide FF receptor 2 n=1 Tax=Acropora cervicornis TaxID=6130 RepID=A0AAD9Q666_ACRCE|nr:Neuropeptide FF receptor 2 [Acropora cervicornis]